MGFDPTTGKGRPAIVQADTRATVFYSGSGTGSNTLYYAHFDGTSFVAEDADGDLLGFVCGFLSQTFADEAYIHFVGVTPEDRGEGLGRTLYERFFDEARANGRTLVRCVTSPSNEGSIAFHEAMGFEVERVVEDYDGPGEDRALLVKRLT